MDTSFHIAIVEDHRDWRDAMVQALSSVPDYDIHAYGSVEAFIEVFADSAFDLVIMDINLPGASGIEGVTHISSANTDVNVIMCTAFDDDERLFASLQAGACGYLLKRCTLEDLLEAVEQVRAGGAPMTPSVARRVLTSMHRPSLRNEHRILTKREQEILDLLSVGRSYRDIAATLCISINTVQSHVRSVYGKLHITSRMAIQKPRGKR
jgi:DNA-binding NarL/FixJ family response regulator